MQSIQCKFTDRLVVPQNAIDTNPVVEYVTADGVRCRLKYLVGMDNRDGRHEQSLDDFCRMLYHHPFSSIRSIWIARLGRVSDHWYVVEMEKI